MSEFKKIINSKGSEIECPYCGAIYDIHMERCPYCDSINELGAEEDYLNDLEDIRKNLEMQDDFTQDMYVDAAKKTMKKALKVLITILIVLASIVVVIFIAYATFKAHQEVKQRQELNWQKENFKKLDAWYDAGDYDAINDFVNQMYDNGEYHETWRWEHYEFMQAYYKYSYIKEYEEKYNDGTLYGYEEKYFFNDAMQLIFDVWDIKLNSAKNINKKEYNLIMEYREYARDLVKEYYNLSDEELDEFSKEIQYDPPGVGIDYNKCDKLLEKIKSEM